VPDAPLQLSTPDTQVVEQIFMVEVLTDATKRFVLNVQDYFQLPVVCRQTDLQLY